MQDFKRKNWYEIPAAMAWVSFTHFFFSSGVKSLILQDFPMEKIGKEHGNLNVVTVMMEYFYIMNLATMESYKKKP